MNIMKNIFLVPNPKKDIDYKVTGCVAEKLKSLGCTLYISDIYNDFKNDSCVNVKDIPENSELIIVIGGDGSFIDAASFAIRLDIPILGINLGKVGYLSEIEPDDLSLLSGIATDEYKINNKMLLEAYVSKDGESKLDRLAVNDIVLSHHLYLGIADFVLFSKEGGVRYRADGLVVSTPAGSTAYSLSAGGPIVSHDAGAVIVTPIASHSFFNRSIVFGANEEIRIKNTSCEALNLSIDGRFYYELTPGEKCLIKPSDKTLKVLTFKDNNMFSNLFSKMKILEDVI